MSSAGVFVKVRELARHSAVYGIGSALQTLIGFVLIPLYTKHYTTEIYGVFSLLTLCGTFAGSIFFLGASSALSRFYHEYSEEKRHKAVVGTCLTLTLLGAATQILLGMVLAGRISEWLFATDKYALHVRLVFASSAMAFTNTFFFVLLRFAKRSSQVVAVNFFTFVVGISLISYLLLGLKLGVLAPVLGDCINQLLLLGVLFFLHRRRVWFAFSREDAVRQLKYGLPTMLAGLAFYLLTWIDRLLLKEFSNLGEVGIYSLGYRLGTGIHMLYIIPFAQIWAPMRMEHRLQADAPEFYKRVLTYYFAIGAAITATLGIFSHEVVGLLDRGHDYGRAADVIPLVMFGHLLYGAVNIVDCGIVFSGKTYWHTCIFGACAILNAALNVLLIPLYGARGAALTVLLTFGALVTLVYCVSNRLFPMQVEFSRLIRVGLVTLSAVGLAQIVIMPVLPGIFVKLGLLAVTFAALMRWVLSAEERLHLFGFIAGIGRWRPRLAG